MEKEEKERVTNDCERRKEITSAQEIMRNSMNHGTTDKAEVTLPLYRSTVASSGKN